MSGPGAAPIHPSAILRAPELDKLGPADRFEVIFAVNDVLMADPYWDVDDGSKGQANHGRVWSLMGRSSRYAATNSTVDGSAHSSRLTHPVPRHH